MPVDVVTVTWTVPVPTGEVATTVVLFGLLVIVPAVEPKVTAEALERLVPVIVTEVPPATDPLLGEIEATTGVP